VDLLNHSKHKITKNPQEIEGFFIYNIKKNILFKYLNQLI
jgi:hypothetical protein